MNTWKGFMLTAALLGCFTLVYCSRGDAPAGADETAAAEAAGEAAAEAPASTDAAAATAHGAAAPAAGGGQSAPASNPPAGQTAAPPAPAATPPPAAPPPPPQPREVTLAEGTPLIVRTTTTLSTKTVKTGQGFTATLEEPLMDGMTLIAPKGATVQGVVANSDPGGRVKGVASIAVRLTALNTDSGETIDISTGTVGFEAGKSTKKDALKVGIGSGVGAAIGAIAGGGKGAAIGAGVGAGAGTAGVLATRGKAAEIPAETVLNFELAAPATVTIQP